jgi:hypothetical protein
MSNIEHSEYICDDGCGRVDVRGAVEGPWPLCLNCGARVTEYVPADAYRGAVEALRWALGFIEYQGEPSPLDDPRGASTSDPIIGGSPHGQGDALIDARAAVLLDHADVVLVDTKRESEPVSMLLSLGGRINYSDDRTTVAYLMNGDGAAAIVSQLVGLASRAAGMHGDPHGEEFAADFKLALERRMGEMP